MKISRKHLPAHPQHDEATVTGSPPSLRLDEWLPYQCFVPAQHTARLLGEFYGPRFGISQQAWRILATIAHRSGASARQICGVLGMDAVSVSRGIAQLVAAGLAQRDAAKNDRRYASVTITATGRAAFDEIAAIGVEIERRMLATLTDEQRVVLRDALLLVGRESERIANIGWQRLLAEATGARNLPDSDTGAGGRMTIFMFAMTALLWGCGALMTAFQNGVVPAPVSVAYRMAAAGVLLLSWSRMNHVRLAVRRADVLWIAAQGVLFFGFAFTAFYEATQRVASGIAALLLSTSSIFAALLGWAMLGIPMTRRVLGGAAIGVVGVALIFAPQLMALGSANVDGVRSAFNARYAAGLAWAVVAAMATASGTVIGARNQGARYRRISDPRMGSADRCVVLRRVGTRGAPFAVHVRTCRCVTSAACFIWRLQRHAALSCCISNSCSVWVRGARRIRCRSYR